MEDANIDDAPREIRGCRHLLGVMSERVQVDGPLDGLREVTLSFW